jgi:hypothetical protein
MSWNNISEDNTKQLYKDLRFSIQSCCLPGVSSNAFSISALTTRNYFQQYHEVNSVIKKERVSQKYNIFQN